MSTQCALQIRVNLAGSTLPPLATQVQYVSTSCLQSAGDVDSPLILGSTQPCAVKVWLCCMEQNHRNGCFPA